MNEGGEKRALAVVQGFVQGVGYRHFALRTAQRFSLRGYVRNLPDGNVEVVMEGPQPAILQMLEALRRGPSYSQVRHLDLTWFDSRGEFKDFGVRF